MTLDSTKPIRPHWSFWGIAVLALVWHVPAIANVVMQMNTPIVEGSADPFQAILAQRPAWATAGFAVFAIAGTLGSLLLLFRKSSALYLFVVSLVGVVVHYAGLIGIKDVPTEMTMGCIMSLIGAVFFIWYCRRATRYGWIR